MRNSTRLTIEIAAVIAVAVIAFFLGRNGLPQFASGPAPAPANSGVSNPTREAVPAGVSVPEKGAAVAANVAAPQNVVAAGTDTTFKKRTFALNISGGTVTPDTIIVRQWDAADITFTSADQEYSFVQPDYGMSFTVPKGGSKMIEAQFTQTGKFLFYCPACGGPAAGPRAYIIVAPQDAP